jgi:hypothetical protein
MKLAIILAIVICAALSFKVTAKLKYSIYEDTLIPQHNADQNLELTIKTHEMNPNTLTFYSSQILTKQIDRDNTEKIDKYIDSFRVKIADVENGPPYKYEIPLNQIQFRIDRLNGLKTEDKVLDGIKFKTFNSNTFVNGIVTIDFLDLSRNFFELKIANPEPESTEINVSSQIDASSETYLNTESHRDQIDISNVSSKIDLISGVEVNRKIDVIPGMKESPKIDVEENSKSNVSPKPDARQNAKADYFEWLFIYFKNNIITRNANSEETYSSITVFMSKNITKYQKAGIEFYKDKGVCFNISCKLIFMHLMNSIKPEIKRPQTPPGLSCWLKRVYNSLLTKNKILLKLLSLPQHEAEVAGTQPSTSNKSQVTIDKRDNRNSRAEPKFNNNIKPVSEQNQTDDIDLPKLQKHSTSNVNSRIKRSSSISKPVFLNSLSISLNLQKENEINSSRPILTDRKEEKLTPRKITLTGSTVRSRSSFFKKTATESISEQTSINTDTKILFVLTENEEY